MTKCFVFLAALAAFASSSSWATKPPYTCKATGSAPNFQLGGFDVSQRDHATGLDMINKLWRKTLGDKYRVDIKPSTDFSPENYLASLDGDENFSFQVNSAGVYRGVGVQQPGVRGDEEVDQNEGLYIYFGGMEVNEVSFGIRALFNENRPGFLESGMVNIYKNGVMISNNHMTFATDGNDGDDGKEHFDFRSDQAFDAVSFITHSHSSLGDDASTGHDFFLEYLDICGHKPKIAGD